MGNTFMFTKRKTKKGKLGNYYEVLDPALSPKKLKTLHSLESPSQQDNLGDTALNFFEHVPPVERTLPPYGRLVQEDLASLSFAGKELCPYIRNCSRNRISGEIYEGTCALINGKCTGEYAIGPIGKPSCPEYQKFWNPRKGNVEKIIALYSR